MATQAIPAIIKLIKGLIGASAASQGGNILTGITKGSGQSVNPAAKAEGGATAEPGPEGGGITSALGGILGGGGSSQVDPHAAAMHQKITNMNAQGINDHLAFQRSLRRNVRPNILLGGGMPYGGWRRR